MEKDLEGRTTTGWELPRRSSSQAFFSFRTYSQSSSWERGGSELLKRGYGHLTWHRSNCWLAPSESHWLIPTWSTAGSGSGDAAASNARADHLASSQETPSSPSTSLPKSSIFFIIDWAVNVIIKGGLTDEIAPLLPLPPMHTAHINSRNPTLG